MTGEVIAGENPAKRPVAPAEPIQGELLERIRALEDAAHTYGYRLGYSAGAEDERGDALLAACVWALFGATLVGTVWALVAF